MSESWRLLDLGLLDPYDGEPVKEVLLTAFKKNLIPNTLCFYAPRRSVWVGRITSMEERLNLEYCRREKIPIMRGLFKGGGAVNNGDCIQCILVSNGILNGDDIRSADNYVVKGIQRIGLEAVTVQGNNVLLGGNRKVAALVNNITFNGGFITYGLVLVDFNYDFCENVLKPVPQTFMNKEAKSHREWVTSLKAELGRVVSFNEVVSAIRSVFESELQVEFDISTSLTDVENQILEGLRKKYRSEEWLKTGRWSPVKDYGM